MTTTNKTWLKLDGPVQTRSHAVEWIAVTIISLFVIASVFKIGIWLLTHEDRAAISTINARQLLHGDAMYKGAIYTLTYKQHTIIVLPGTGIMHDPDCACGFSRNAR